MPAELKSSQTYRMWPITKRLALGASVIGAVVTGIVACFVYVGGFLSPGRLTQTRMINAFQETNGLHPGFRRNHAKGVCVTGHFESNGNGASLSRAVVFQPGTIPIVGRFSVAGGKPFMPDSDAEVRAMAISFRPPGGEEWRTGMLDIPVLLVANAKGFYDLLVASRPEPTTGKPDPSAIQAFFANHPESARALQLIKSKPFSSGFANASYNGLDAFQFVNADGSTTPVRWSMVAVDTFMAETPATATPTDKNFLFDDLIARIERDPAQWHLVVTLGEPGDPTDDATIPWPDERKRVDVGTLTIDHIEAEAPGNCRDVNFDPLVLPSGIQPSDDPLLSARSATYSTSFRRRAGEPKTPSDVQIPAANKGA